MLYFGAVDWQKDDFIPIKGFSVSTTHVDNHYCVGTIDDYNVRLVNRFDAIVGYDNSIKYNNLLITSIELKTKIDIPHIFINSVNNSNCIYNLLFENSRYLKALELGLFESYSPEFLNRFTIYANPIDNIFTQKLFDSNTTKVLSSHFWPYSAEIKDNILYIYSNAEKASIHTLDTMATVGIWLAKNIDSVVESI